jgi:uracil-DNA glycosylase
MSLDRRQIAMLREMGVPFWPAPRLGSQTPVVPDSAPARRPGGLPDALMQQAQEAPDLPDVPDAGRAGPSSVRPAPALPPGQPDPVSLPADESVAAMDWSALQEAVRRCQACALCSSRKNTVFGVGHPRAHWMVVGEAPGEQEDLRGEPFVGPAGVLLDRMLAALGLSRSPAQRTADTAGTSGAGAADRDADASRRVYITNTLKCRPPRNRNPEPQEMQRCEPFLQRQIALVQPRLILAMGRFAVQALLRTDEAIGRLRGRVHRYQGVPLVVTYHPAYLLRNPADKAKAWDDLCLAAHTLTSTDPER